MYCPCRNGCEAASPETTTRKAPMSTSRDRSIWVPPVDNRRVRHEQRRKISSECESISRVARPASDGRSASCEERVDRVEDVGHVHDAVAVHVALSDRHRPSREQEVDEIEDVRHIEAAVAVHCAAGTPLDGP